MISQEATIEAILFSMPEAVRVSELAKILDTSESSIQESLVSLKESLLGRGIILMEQDGKVALVTVPEVSEILEKIKKDELTKELSKAALETLSIILYRGEGVTRSEIDYIRGVNSSFILRNLSMRGLVIREGGNKAVYKPTMDLLSYMGISSVSELPDYAEISGHITTELSNQVTE